MVLLLQSPSLRRQKLLFQTYDDEAIRIMNVRERVSSLYEPL
jgi:hypothetical protein